MDTGLFGGLLLNEKQIENLKVTKNEKQLLKFLKLIIPNPEKLTFHNFNKKKQKN